MTPTPTGQLVKTPDGVELVINRVLAVPIADVWKNLTNSEYTTLWIGPWTGEGRPGATILLQMTVEEAGEPSPVTITECDPPRKLSLEVGFPDGTAWSLRVQLSEQDGSTTVVLHQLLHGNEGVGEIGPGWEFYADRFVATATGAAMPSWEDYYPAQKTYYEQATPT